MEKDSPSKVSVAELAGRFKGHILPMPTSNDELPFRRRPPSSLKLQGQKEDNEETDKAVAPQNPFKMKMKNSPIIEKLQANLALSPSALLPTPKNPEVKLQPAPLSPDTPRSPLSPSLQQSGEEEDPVGFSSPPEGTTLPSINKTRARLSFKRRPPTRQHRRSAGEDTKASAISLSPCELDQPEENGDEDSVLDSPTEGAERGLPADQGEAEDRDCDKAEEEDSGGAPQEEQKAERAESVETLEEEEQTSEPGATERIGAADETEEGQEELAQEELAQEEH